MSINNTKQSITDAALLPVRIEHRKHRLLIDPIVTRYGAAPIYVIYIIILIAPTLKGDRYHLSQRITKDQSITDTQHSKTYEYQRVLMLLIEDEY